MNDKDKQGEMCKCYVDQNNAIKVKIISWCLKLNFAYNMNAFAGFMDLKLCELSTPVYYTT